MLFGGHDLDLDLTQIVLLASLGELNSLSASANRIGVSQSAASHALARLRRQLGDPLFVRTPTGLRATPYGESLSRASQAALETLRIGLESNRPFDPRTSTRTFNVYMSDVGQMVFLPRLLAHLGREAPGVSVQVRPIPLENQGAALQSGEVDLALGYFTTLSGGFRQRLLFRERYVCVSRRDHPQFRRGMTREAFRAVPHAATTSSGMGHALLERALQRADLEPPRRLAVPQFMVLPLVIANSDLLVVMPSRLAEEFAKLVPIQLMPLPVKIPTYDIRVFWHERYHHDRANRWLRELFATLFQE